MEDNNVTSKRSEKYYMDIVVFKVEDTLFKVPKAYFVKNSPIFRDMFSLPPVNAENAEGTSDNNPLILEDVKAADFELLLEYMYPEQVHPLFPTDASLPPSRAASPLPPGVPPLGWLSEGRERLPEEYVATSAATLHLLALCRRWLFLGLHAQIVENLSKGRSLSRLQLVQAGKAHAIPHWLREGYISFSLDLHPKITLEEAKGLGWEESVKIFNLREELMDPANSRQSRYWKEGRVSEVFEEAIKAAEEEYGGIYVSE